MRINRIDSSTNFKSLYMGGTITKRLADKRCTKFPKQLKEIKDIIKLNQFDKKENVDIILNVKDKSRFYAIISSKKQGIPMNPYDNCDISTDDKSIQKFANWLNSWNENYSPEKLNFLEKILKNKYPIT